MKRYLYKIAGWLLLSAICLSFVSCGEGGDPCDGKVYDSRYIAENCIYLGGTSGLSSAYFENPGVRYNECINPLCDHTEASGCESFMDGVGCAVLVDSDGDGFPLIYMAGRRQKNIYSDGDISHNPDYELYRIKVYDTKTGKGREICEIEFSGAENMFYCDGKLYISADFDSSGAVRHRVGCVDVATGGWSEVNVGVNARIIGIWDERVYYITNRAEVYSIDMELGDSRLEYECGATAIGSSGYFNVYAEVSDGILYFRADQRSEHNGEYNVYDVYSVDLAAVVEPLLIAEGVRRSHAYEGDLYYTLFDYSRDEETLISSADGGTLYKYSPDTKKSEVVFEDLGYSVDYLYEIGDGKLLFRGMMYRDVPEEDIEAIRLEYESMIAEESELNGEDYVPLPFEEYVDMFDYVYLERTYCIYDLHTDEFNVMIDD